MHVFQAKKLKDLERENARLKKLVAEQFSDKAILEEAPTCRVLGQPRSTQRRRLVVRDDEGALTRAIVDLASEYGRYGYRRITALLRHQGWHVNHRRVERI
jgi:hypothetical protein